MTSTYSGSLGFLLLLLHLHLQLGRPPRLILLEGHLAFGALVSAQLDRTAKVLRYRSTPPSLLDRAVDSFHFRPTLIWDDLRQISSREATLKGTEST
jgi:hypothetical protein